MSAQQSALPSADIFTKINDPSEKANLFSDLAKARGKILAKTTEPGSDLHELSAFDFHDNKIYCQSSATYKLKDFGDLILYFFVGSDKYFIQSKYKIRKDNIEIDTDSTLYHLQRRQDYRLRIPMGYSALYEVVSINGTPKKHSFRLQDLSGGGCRIEIPIQSNSLKIQDLIKGHLFLPDRQPIVVDGSIRHTMVDAQKKFLICGVQFVGITAPQKNKIVALVMDLYRQFFAGRS